MIKNGWTGGEGLWRSYKAFAIGGLFFLGRLSRSEILIRHFCIVESHHLEELRIPWWCNIEEQTCSGDPAHINGLLL